MQPIFNVTLVNLDSDARTAVPDKGRLALGKIPADQLTVLLEAFRELDPLQNMEADPEIVVEARREKYLIRTDHKNLFLYNVRNTAEPAYKLTPIEIIAELDGSAASARTTAPFAPDAPTPTDSLNYVPPPPAAPRKPPIALATIAVLLGGYAFYLGWTTLAEQKSMAVPYTQITDPVELSKASSSIAGVYLTGSEPGHHGIAVLQGGAIKLFQLNYQVAPGVIHDTYRLGRLGTKLCLITSQPGGAIEARDRDTLVYCGEMYQRIP